MEQVHPEQQRTEFLLLTGAPRCKDLAWTEINLTVKLQQPFQSDDRSIVKDPSAATPFPAWRELHLKPRYFHTGFSQCHYPVFFHGDHEHVNEDSPRHDSIGASANIATDSFISDSLSLSAIESFRGTWTVPSQFSDPLLRCIRITDLSKLPAANALDLPSRHRSGLVNLLVLILTAPSPQTIQIKKPGVKKEADLIRLSVADETCTIFEISVWLDSMDRTTSENIDLFDNTTSSLGKTVSSLQKHDIVLIQNVALRVFQNKVGASSIRGLTEIKLLYRDYPTNAQHKLPIYPIGIWNHFAAGDGIPGKITKILRWRDTFLDTSAPVLTRSKKRRLEQGNRSAAGAGTTIQLPADTQ